MTREEKEFCKSCPHHNDCGFISRRLEYKCDKLDDFLSGWEKAIDKACEWLKENCNNVETEDNGISGWISNEFIEQFRKAMRK